MARRQDVSIGTSRLVSFSASGGCWAGFSNDRGGLQYVPLNDACFWVSTVYEYRVEALVEIAPQYLAINVPTQKDGCKARSPVIRPNLTRSKVQYYLYTGLCRFTLLLRVIL